MMSVSPFPSPGIWWASQWQGHCVPTPSSRSQLVCSAEDLVWRWRHCGSDNPAGGERVGGEGWRGEGGGEGVEGVDTMSTYSHQWNWHWCSQIPPGLAGTAGSLSCSRSHDRSHDSVNTLTWHHMTTLCGLTWEDIDISVLCLVHIFVSRCKAVGISLVHCQPLPARLAIIHVRHQIQWLHNRIGR